jgi:F0F1-type ATP synthase assembly protein I
MDFILMLAVSLLCGWLVGNVIGWWMYGKATYSSPWTKRPRSNR